MTNFEKKRLLLDELLAPPPLLPLLPSGGLTLSFMPFTSRESQYERNLLI